MKTLLLGGVRSGKSRYAAELARELSLPVTLIVTGAALDEEMERRIEAHRASRPADWIVVEEPTHLAAARLSCCASASNHHRRLPDAVAHQSALQRRCSTRCGANRTALLETLPTLPGHCILVANEVGLGIIPVNASRAAILRRGGRFAPGTRATVRAGDSHGGGAACHREGRLGRDDRLSRAIVSKRRCRESRPLLAVSSAVVFSVATGALFCLGVCCGAPAAHAVGFVLRDDLQREVSFPHHPQRIISLMPSLTETVCALGACERLVATDRFSNWPAQVKSAAEGGRPR